MKIYDGFLFNDELDLLELRLMELGDLVDVFVLVEMQHNFMQQPKPWHFGENRRRFDRWLHKIWHLGYSISYPIAPHPVMEHWQRRKLAEGLSAADPDDVVLIGDVDEIPSREVVENARRLPPDHPFTCVQRLYYYYVNCEQACPWGGTVIGPRRAFGKDMDCQKVRDDRHSFPKLWQAGWHFSWLGPLASVQNKLDCIDVAADAKLYGTPEIVKPSSADVAHLEHCLTTGADLFRRTDPYAQKTFVPIDPGVRQPKCILEWLELHPEYAVEVPVP